MSPTETQAVDDTEPSQQLKPQYISTPGIDPGHRILRAHPFTSIEWKVLDTTGWSKRLVLREERDGDDQPVTGYQVAVQYVHLTRPELGVHLQPEFKVKATPAQKTRAELIFQALLCCPDCTHKHHEAAASCEECGACLYQHSKQVQNSDYPLFSCTSCQHVNFWD